MLISFSDLEIYELQEIANQGLLKLNILFNEDVNSIDFLKLKTKNIPDYEKKATLEIQTLSMEKVIRSLDYGNVFKKEKLKVSDDMRELIKVIEDNNKIIPPFIININGQKWTIMDGHHRIDLMNYLEIQNAPFLIRKVNHLAAKNLI